MADGPIPPVATDAPEPRLAATIVLLRDVDEGPPQVLMLRRHARSGFAASAWVFPGGVVDHGDARIPDQTWQGIDPDALTRVFDADAATILGLHVAAVRETFEEAGVMLATHSDGRAVDTLAPALVQARAAANERGSTVDWGAFLDEHDLILDLGSVTLLSRWITPLQEPRRYDTWFFIARLPHDAAVSPDNVETTQARWVSAAQALADPDFFMIFPTIRTLEQLGQLSRAADLIDRARDQGPITPIQPHILTDAEGNSIEIILPDDDRYPREATSCMLWMS